MAIMYKAVQKKADLNVVPQNSRVSRPKGGELENFKDVFVVIPAYNEERMIRSVIDELRKQEFHNIVVVDDGSDDATARIALEEGAIVLQHPINRGQGAALKTGTDFAVQQNASIIVHFDADGQMRSQDIVRLVEPIRKGKVRMSFGSRFMNKQSNIPVLRRLFLKGGRVFMKVLYGVNMTDPQSGFRAMDAQAAQHIVITQRSMAHCSEIIDEVHRKKIPYCEVPVIIKYTEYSLMHGQNNLAAFRIAAKLLWKRMIR